MFDKIKDYLTPGQFPLIAAFVAWWLLGGAWLLQRSLQRRAGLRRLGLGPCVLSLFLAGLGALAVGGLTYVLIQGATARAADEGSPTRQVISIVSSVPIGLLILLAAVVLVLKGVGWLRQSAARKQAGSKLQIMVAAGLKVAPAGPTR